tara:strand:+ start:1324 stop:2319 length:996 start_codon:yes stop_codon:yes gene_type:complete
MNAGRYVMTVALLLAVSVLYEKYKASEARTDPDSDYNIVRKYLLGGQGESKPGLPVIWIHAGDNINPRWWPTFGSRNTRCLNQPYEMLTVASIVRECRRDFSVCVIHDRDFKELVPGWTADLDQIADPLRTNMRKLALARLLQAWGGLLVPSTFLAFRSLKPVYDSACAAPGQMVACEIQEEMGRGPPDGGPGRHTRYPRPRFMGCVAGSKAMGEYAAFLEHINTTDHTAESAFRGEEAMWCLRAAQKGIIATVPPELLGVEDAKGQPIGVERLLGTSYVPLCSGAFGLYVPAQDLRRRTAYGWFSRQSTLQALGSDTALGKYLLVASGAH